jgi:hypothetical protein
VAQAVCGGFESNDLSGCECSSYTVQRRSLRGRWEFNRLTSPPAQLRQTFSSQRANSQNWGSTRRVLDDEDDSPTNALTANKCASGSEATDLDTDFREHDFTPQRQQALRWKLANIDDTNSFVQATQTKATSTRQPVALPKEAEVARCDSGRYDIATLECWQAANGGSGLATA